MPPRKRVGALLVLAWGVASCGGSSGEDAGRPPSSSASVPPASVVTTAPTPEVRALHDPVAPAGSSARAREAASTATTAPGPASAPDGLTVEECSRRLQEAKTADEREAADDYCDAVERAAPPYASRPQTEPVTLEQGTAWWPYRPVMRADIGKLPEPGAVESVFALGTRAADPRSEPAALMLLYQYPGATADRANYYEILLGGGFSVQHTNFAKGQVRGAYPGHTEPVVVHGRPATLVELRRPQINVDWRVITWQEAGPDGGVLYWDVGFHPERYSKDESLHIAEGLVEAR